jgi:hypothetical protein
LAPAAAVQQDHPLEMDLLAAMVLASAVAAAAELVV